LATEGTTKAGSRRSLQVSLTRVLC